MKPARDLTGPQLAARIETLSPRIDAINAELIAAGRGLDRPSDIRSKDDPLSLLWVEITDRYREARDEQSRRLAYHGTLRPIGGQA